MIGKLNFVLFEIVHLICNYSIQGETLFFRECTRHCMARRSRTKGIDVETKGKPKTTGNDKLEHPTR